MDPCEVSPPRRSPFFTGNRRLHGVADSLCIVPPIYGLGAEKVMFYAAMIGETFYGAR